VKTVRDIARDEAGYTKLLQMFIVSLLSFVFLSVIVYYFLNPGLVDRIDIVLTVVVGWLGAIIGNFFGEKAMAHLEDKRRISISRLINKISERELLTRDAESIIRKILKKE